MIERARKQYKTIGFKGLFFKANRFFAYWCIQKSRKIRFTLMKLTSPEKQVVKEIQGSKMCLDMTDPGISSELFFDGIREIGATEFVKTLLKEGDVVADIGANIGYYALMESRLVGDTGKVYAIEPINKNIQHLQNNINLNRCKNICLLELAIGDENKRETIYLSEKSNLNSMIDHEDLDIIGKTEVDMLTFDTFLQEKEIEMPKMVRMDVEGYEYEIIEGMPKTLSSENSPILFIELHTHILGKLKTKDLLIRLKEYGYDILHIVRNYNVVQLKYFEKTLPKFNYSKIDELILDDNFLSGEFGTFHIFFKKY